MERATANVSAAISDEDFTKSSGCGAAGFPYSSQTMQALRVTSPVAAVVAVGALVVLSGLYGTGVRVVEAHHSYGAYYLDRHVSIEGQIERFIFRSPHSLIELSTADGKMYVAEWDTVPRLQSAGVNSTTLKAGDRIVVTGNPARDSLDRRLALLTEVRRPSDGWLWKKER